MPFVLIFTGLMLTVVAVRDNQDAFYAQLQKDFTGQKSFTNWGIAVVGIGALGYIKPIKPIIDPFLILMIIGFFISNAGGLANLLPSLQQAFDNVSGGLSSGLGSLNQSQATPGTTGSGNQGTAVGDVGQTYANNPLGQALNQEYPTNPVYEPGFNPLTYQIQ